MRRGILIIFLCGVCAACSQGSGGTNVLPPGSPGAPESGASPAPSVSPSFDPASVHVTEYAVPITPQYVGAAGDGSVYFGYGGNGTGSNLYRFAGGALSQTPQGAPPGGYLPGGGVYGIATNADQVYWLSAYGGPGFSPYTAVECGGNGRAAVCEPTVEEPTSMVVDPSGTFWIGGWTYNGNGEIATSSGASAQFAGGIVQLLRGPNQAVWGVLEAYPNYRIVEFALSSAGISIVQSFALPSGESAGSITYGGDGALWFTDSQTNAIGRMTGTGALTEFPLSTPNALGSSWFGLWQIATACDGSVWFTEPNAGKVARIAPDGPIAQFSLPTADGYGNAIAAAPQMPCTAPQLWVGEQRSNRIVSIRY